ncbi:MAG TPA: nitroreductase family protein [Candidatus Cloacimonadota bacterium]|nr:nitroreductase family protein [Candidatus Cloacimonadota bacterium]HPM03316.1 nitroreductase family protein [Candidatus Cloacimonadota bacterium]
MNLNDLITKRRALRSIEKVTITDDMIYQLADAAKMAPSCYNKQPWHFVFVRSENQLEKMHEVMSKGNEWTYNSSLMIAVYSRKEEDCIVGSREYYAFDTGMASAFLQLKAVELGLSIHPIAGFNEEKAKTILNIPDEYQLLTILICGKETDRFWSSLGDQMLQIEKNRPPRKSFEEFCSIDKQ